MEERSKEYDFMINPHPHPLVFYRQGKPENVGGGEEAAIFCSICDDLFRPPAFGCSQDDCNFYVHQSCIKLPPEIPNPFSTTPHVFSLDNSNNFRCNCCLQTPYDFTYVCNFLTFTIRLDLQCAITLTLDPKTNSLLKTTTADGGMLFRHFRHRHPLTLHLSTYPDRKTTTISICIVCEAPIKPFSTYYFCPQSQPYCHSYTFHSQCAELPRQILDHHLHPHPLFLFALPWISNTICINCKNECKGFFYSCLSCSDSINLHVNCVSSFKHEHDFKNLHRKLRNYDCQLCLKPATNDFPWLCTICHQFAHKKCAITQMSQHLHHQSLAKTSSTDNDIHKNEISHFSHKEHMLTLCEPQSYHDEYKLCEGCMTCLSTRHSQFYCCQLCNLYLHTKCATLPTQYDNPFHHQHKLSMVYTPDFVFSCRVCLQYCHGFAYLCEECHYIIDIRCAASITFQFKHSSHQHQLYDYEGNVEHKCKACGEKLMHKKSVGCEECNFYLDLRCAHLPSEVRNRFDEHPLSLTFGTLHLPTSKKILTSTIEKGKEKEKKQSNIGDNEEYYCDICEKERKKEEWFYYCRLCCFAAHPKCVIGEFPFLKSIQFEGHPHPLNWVLKEKLFHCGACQKPYDGNLVFECRLCKDFNVHAVGKCYQHQLTQGRITSIMPSLRYRSIPHY